MTTEITQHNTQQEPAAQTKKKGNSLSNKRIKEFKDALIEDGFDKTDRIIELLCKVVDFDPHYGTGQYNEDRRNRLREWRKKKMEEYGVPMGMVITGKYKNFPKVQPQNNLITT